MKANAMRIMLWITLTSLVAVTPSVAQTTCGITAPSSTGVNQSFTLCGPTGGGYTYQWYGPGLGSGGQSRCVASLV